MANLLVERAKERLFGRRSAALDPAQVTENLTGGTDATQWPRGAADWNPLAAKLTAELRRRRAR